MAQLQSLSIEFGGQSNPTELTNARVATLVQAIATPRTGSQYSITHTLNGSTQLAGYISSDGITESSKYVLEQNGIKVVTEASAEEYSLNAGGISSIIEGQELQLYCQNSDSLNVSMRSMVVRVFIDFNLRYKENDTITDTNLRELLNVEGWTKLSGEVWRGVLTDINGLFKVAEPTKNVDWTLPVQFQAYPAMIDDNSDGLSEDQLEEVRIQRSTPPITVNVESRAVKEVNIACSKSSGLQSGNIVTFYIASLGPANNTKTKYVPIETAKILNISSNQGSFVNGNYQIPNDIDSFTISGSVSYMDRIIPFTKTYQVIQTAYSSSKNSTIWRYIVDGMNDYYQSKGLSTRLNYSTDSWTTDDCKSVTNEQFEFILIRANDAGFNSVFTGIEYFILILKSSSIVIDQSGESGSTPTAMISGSTSASSRHDPSSNVVSWIRANSCQYISKQIGQTLYMTQLDRNDGTKTADNNAVTYLPGIDSWMKLPRFWYKCEETSTDKWKLTFSKVKLDSDYNEWNGKEYIATYEACSSNGLPYSASGVASTAWVSQTDWRSMVTKRDLPGLSLVKWQHHNIIGLLWYAYSGYLNSQSVVGSGKNTTAQVMGQSNSLGMRDTTTANAPNIGVRLWGLEHWHGDMREWIDNVSVDGPTGMWTITEDEFSSPRVVGPDAKAEGWITKMLFGPKGDLIPTAVGGSATSYFSDYFDYSSKTDRRVVRSHSGSDTGGGVGYVDTKNNYWNVYGNYGTRLAFSATIGSVKMKSGSEFLSLPNTAMGTRLVINQSSSTITSPVTMVEDSHFIPDAYGLSKRPTSSDIDDITKIRDNSHCYVGKVIEKDNGRVVEMHLCQLSDASRKKFKDGSSATSYINNASGGYDVWMKLPAFYWRCVSSNNKWIIYFFYPETIDGIEVKPLNVNNWNYWDGNDLIGVYEATSISSKLYSASTGAPSTGGLSQDTMKTQARNRGRGFTLVKWKHHNMMALLWYAYSGTLNSRSIVGRGIDSYTSNLGSTDELCMTDTSGDNSVLSTLVNLWGLEAWHGDKFEWIDNVNIDNVTGVWTITEDDGTTRTVKMGSDAINKQGTIKSMVFGNKADLIPNAIDADTTYSKWYADKAYTVSTNTDNIVLRSGEALSTYGGVGCFYANVRNDDQWPDAGSRLAFRGTCIIDDVSTFSAL